MKNITFISIAAFNIALFQATMSYVAASTSSSTIDAAQNVTATSTYCSCQYNVPTEAEADCRSYGQLGDDVLIPWHRANLTCLDEYKIKVAAIDRDVLFAMCPYENTTDVDLQLLLNEIRNNPSPATRAIQASYPEFWIASNTTLGSYELVDVINDGRNNPNCIESETLCYNTIREYFTVNPSTLATICKDLHSRNRFDMDLEQSTIQMRLCQEVDTASDISQSCEPLVTQVREIKNKNPSKSCAAFGLGPGTQELPNSMNSNCGGITLLTSGSHSTNSRYYHATLLISLIAITIMRL